MVGPLCSNEIVSGNLDLNITVVIFDNQALFGQNDSIEEGASTGVLLCTDEGLPSFYITLGTYQVSADFGTETKTTQLEILEDGEYTLVFE